MHLVETDGFITVWPERAECDFTVPSRTVALTQCAYCLKTIPQSHASLASYNGEVEHFCNDEEAETYHYVRWLSEARRAGL
jgi:hypothetical protein